MASSHDDLGLYVLGVHEAPEEFEAHLETCGQCRDELRQLRGALDVVDANTSAPSPPSDLRERTLAAVRASRATEGPVAPSAPVVSLEAVRNRRRRFVGTAAVAALAVVVAGLGYRSLTRDGFSADRLIALSAPDGGPARGEARIDDTASGQVIELEVSGLPAAPPGTYYECWWVGEGDGDDIQNRVSAGTFRGGDGTYRMRTWERGVEGETLACGTGAVACALTLEEKAMASSPVRIWTRSRLPLDVSWTRNADLITSIRLRGEGRLVCRGIVGELPTRSTARGWIS